MTLFDYGVGNLHSLGKALEKAGARVTVTGDPAALARASCLVLPGVGSAHRVMASLAPARAALLAALERGVPALGVCVGMQVLFESSEEGATACVGFWPGAVRRLNAPTLPHIGWAPVAHSGDPLFAGIPSGEFFYFVHSFAAGPDGAIATAAHGAPFAAAWRRGRVWGVQFHPEKSSAAGGTLIGNWVRIASEIPR
ncbi:MAG: imidazole glycerol phosphate synthase subunit HisH [Candidatus Brocadiae bacterium]|nr:imidazole glycerol phosphate synthase subunit HisH [Candidatus Brocadiia bacterium]